MKEDFLCESSEFNGPKCASQCEGCKPGPSDTPIADSSEAGRGVQGSIATKRSSDPEGSSRTETALAIFSALSKAGIEHSAISCNGVNLFGDRKSIEAARAWLHSHGQIDDLKTNLRHWRDECGKLQSKLAAAETDADAQRDDSLLSSSGKMEI